MQKDDAIADALDIPAAMAGENGMTDGNRQGNGTRIGSRRRTLYNRGGRSRMIREWLGNIAEHSLWEMWIGG